MLILDQRADSQPLCDKCGACCRAFPILASEADAINEPRIKLETVELEPWRRANDWHYQLFPLPFLKSCPFLQENQLCAIYETRPAACKRFEPGSFECEEARRRVGLAPLQGTNATS